jgi:hypothetical protein
MSRADKERRALLAKALAEGMHNEAAAEASGYGRQSVSRLRNNPAFQAEVDKVRDDLAWGGSADLAPVINEMLRLARKAGEGTSAASLNVARQVLADIGRLKQAMAASGAARAYGDDDGMTNEDWLEIHGPAS